MTTTLIATITESKKKEGPKHNDLFAHYLGEIGRFPLLTREEEIKLGNQVQDMMKYEKVRRQLDISVEQLARLRKMPVKDLRSIYKIGEAARTKLINHNLRLVVNVAKRYSTINLSFYDMVQEGNAGLIRGAERYNPKYGVKFSTYVSFWIKESINKGITNGGRSIRLPVHVTDKIRVMRQARKDYYLKHGRMPGVNKLIELTGLTRETIARLTPYLRQPVSLDSKIEADINLLDYIADPMPNEGEIKAQRDDCTKMVAELLSYLPELDRHVLCYLYGLLGYPRLTKEQLGERLGVTSQYTRAIERRAIKALQDEFEAVPEVKSYILSSIA
jgi:RNA polymerase nonessential primary-like sigma factor